MLFRNIISRRFHKSRILNSTFDTFRLVSNLEADGWEREKAEAIMLALSDILKDRLTNIVENSVSITDLERALNTIETTYSNAQSQLDSSRNQKINSISIKNSAITVKHEQLSQLVIDELRKIKNTVSSDLSSQKARLREDCSLLELKMRECDAKIGQEVSQIQTELEKLKWELIRTLIPLFCASCALLISYLRFVNK